MSTQRVDKVMANFLSDEEVDPEAISRLGGLQQVELEKETQLMASADFRTLQTALRNAEKAHRKAQAALAAYQDEKVKAPNNMRLAELRQYCSVAVLSGTAKVVPISSASGFKPPVDEKFEQLKREVQEAGIRLTDARTAVDDYPIMEKLHAVRREIRNIVKSLPKTAAKAASSCKEIHGITRGRVTVILDKLDRGAAIEETELAAEPSIYDEIRSYLGRWKISDRLSFERVLFSYSMGRDVADWYGNCGNRGLFPKNLVEIVLGRKLTHLTEADLVVAANKLFGELDKDLVADEVRTLLESRGVNSRSQVLQLSDELIRQVAQQSRAGSAAVLFKILAGVRPRLLPQGCSMAEALADSLFPVN